LELKGYNKFHQTQKAGLNQMAVTLDGPKYEYRPKPEQPQKKTIKNEDGTEYEMVGDYFQCARCD
jgi:hypothetical protein